MNAWTSAWFYLLLIGLVFIIIGSIIRGVKCEMNWWSGSLFLIGFILVLIGLALALWNWASMTNTYERKQVHPAPSPVYYQQSPMYHQYSPMQTRYDVTDRFKYANHPQVIHSPHVTSSPVMTQRVLPISSPNVDRVERIVSIPTLPVMRTTAATVISVPSVTSVPLTSNSPIIPTPVTTNIPQAQRGFATSGVDLSALSPV
jgi:hypothetical protein